MEVGNSRTRAAIKRRLPSITNHDGYVTSVTVAEIMMFVSFIYRDKLLSRRFNAL
jgi:hypothetical protein